MWLMGCMRNGLLQLVRHLPISTARVSVYRLFGMKIGKWSSVGVGCLVLGGPQRITIGAGSIINLGVTLDGRCPLTIGDNVSISIYSIILTLEHDLDAPNFRAVGAPVTIGDRVFIGARALILPGINIGEGAAVAAGTVVTKDVEPFTIVGGVPARPIGLRTRNLTYNWADK